MEENYCEVEFGLEFVNRPESTGKVTIGKFSCDSLGQPNINIETIRNGVIANNELFDQGNDNDDPTLEQQAIMDSYGNRLRRFKSASITVVRRQTFNTID